MTGSSSGLGKAIAIRLSKAGYYVLVHFQKNEAGAMTCLNEIKHAGGDGECLRFDTKSLKEMESALDAFASTQNPGSSFEVLVNNAGIHQDQLLGLMSDEAFDEVIKTNLYGPFYLMRWMTRKMIRQRRGCIVNISSLAGQTGNPGQANYAASKAGLIAMTKTLAMELGGRGIRVNAVAPGLIETDMIQDIPQLEEYKKRIPLQRFGTVEEVAGAVAFLCSPDASYITGHTLSVNGGLFPS